MKKQTQLFSLLSTAILTITLLAPHTGNAQATIIYLHVHEQEAQKRSPENLLQSFTSTGNAIVVFYAEWCGPCKRMAPIVAELADELSEEFIIIKIDIDNYRDLFDGFKLKTVPAILFFKDGEMIYKQPESTTKEKLHKIIHSHY